MAMRIKWLYLYTAVNLQNQWCCQSIKFYPKSLSWHIIMLAIDPFAKYLMCAIWNSTFSNRSEIFKRLTSAPSESPAEFQSDHCAVVCFDEVKYYK